MSSIYHEANKVLREHTIYLGLEGAIKKPNSAIIYDNNSRRYVLCYPDYPTDVGRVWDGTSSVVAGYLIQLLLKTKNTIWDKFFNSPIWSKLGYGVSTIHLPGGQKSSIFTPLVYNKETKSYEPIHISKFHENLWAVSNFSPTSIGEKLPPRSPRFENTLNLDKSVCFRDTTQWNRPPNGVDYLCMFNLSPYFPPEPEYSKNVQQDGNVIHQALLEMHIYGSKEGHDQVVEGYKVSYLLPITVDDLTQIIAENPDLPIESLVEHPGIVDPWVVNSFGGMVRTVSQALLRGIERQQYESLHNSW